MIQHQDRVEEAKSELIFDSSSSCSQLSLEIKRIREKLGLNLESASMNGSSSGEIDPLDKLRLEIWEFGQQDLSETNSE